MKAISFTGRICLFGVLLLFLGEKIRAQSSPCTFAHQQLRAYFLQDTYDPSFTPAYIEGLYYNCTDPSPQTVIAYYYFMAAHQLPQHPEHVEAPNDMFMYYYHQLSSHLTETELKALAYEDPSFSERLTERLMSLRERTSRANRADSRDLGIIDPQRVGQSDTYRYPDGELEDYRLFPIPAPTPTASFYLPSQLVAGRSLGTVAQKMGQGLDQRAYYGKRFYGLPEGFALITQLERIQETGHAYGGLNRWIPWPRYGNFFELEPAQATLRTAAPGRYRMFVFLVAPESILQNPESLPALEDLAPWEGSKGVRLPPGIESLAFQPDYQIRGLVYEFRVGSDGLVRQLRGGEGLSPQVHLAASGLGQSMLPVR